MSSFLKTLDSKSTINGTKLKNNLPIVSSGIPSLDHIIGGGLPTGAIFAVEEDVWGSYSRVLVKYFLAEGAVCRHDLFIANADQNPKDIVKELPQPCAAPVDNNDSSSGGDKMKIAWRYEGLGQVESSFGSNTNFGHHFDLSKTIDDETVKNITISYCQPSWISNNCSNFSNPMYYNLLSSLRSVVSKEQYQNSNKNKNILRISIESLGSAVWLASKYEDDNCFGKDLLKFMFCLKTIIRDTTAVVFITMPSHLFDDDNLTKRLMYSVDNAVKLESFAGSDRETNPVYKEYHGLFHVTKLSAVYSLVPFVPPSLDLAFKLRRKKFVIEKLHLPPELQESSEREQDDITATPATSCGGFKKKDIDF